MYELLDWKQKDQGFRLLLAMEAHGVTLEQLLYLSPSQQAYLG